MKEVCLKAETKPYLQVSGCLGSWQGNGEGHSSTEALGHYNVHYYGAQVLGGG